MRLTELDPRWLANRQGIVYRTPGAAHGWLCTMFGPTLITTQWALCKEVGVDPALVHPSLATHGWDHTGDDFETLTITPSIDLRGGWHGYITNGEIVNA